MIGLLLFNLSHCLNILNGFFETISSNLFNIISTCLHWLCCFLKSIGLCTNILGELLLIFLSCFILNFDVVRSLFYVEKLTVIVIVVLLKLLEFSSLFEKGFWCCTTLIFKNLFLLNISTLSTLDEFVSIIFVSHFQMVKSICQSLDFLFAFTKFSIKLITISLEFFFFLGSLNNIVSLWVVSCWILFSRAWLILLDKTFIFDS